MVVIKNLIGLTARAGGGVEIQRLDGAQDPSPVGPVLSLTVQEWRRTRELLELDAKRAAAEADASTGGGDDGTQVYWRA